MGGLIYIADSNNNRIRLVNSGATPVVLYPNGSAPITILPGQIGTIAGTGVAGYSGDGGPAVQAQVNLPWGLLLDPRGDLFVADYYGQRVRKISLLSGIITTVAGIGVSGQTGDGGPATKAAITFPTTLSLDSAGNLYIGQQQANAVRMVAAGTGIISTVVGTGVSGTRGDGGPAIDAEVNSPTGVAVDHDGNLYIAEYNGGRCRRVNGVTQIISTAAGSTNFGNGLPALAVNFNQPVGFSINAQGLMTFSDQANQEIRLIDSNGIITRVAGTGVSGYNGDGIPATQAQINIPADAQFDSLGNLYICDRGNSRIRRVDAMTNLISTVAGSGQVGYGGDGGLATQAKLNQARAILIDAANNLWIAELDNFRVRYVNLSNQPVTLFAGGPVPLIVGAGIIVTAAGTGVSGSSGDGGPCVDAEVNSPRGVTMDSQGNIYVTEGGRDPQNLPGPNVVPDCKIRKIIRATGIISTVAGTQKVGYNGDGIPATQADLNGPRNVSVDSVGNMYIADSLNNRIRRVDFQTGLISTVLGGHEVGFAGDGGGLADALICTPRYVRLDSQGNLIFSDDGNSRYRKISFG